MTPIKSKQKILKEQTPKKNPRISTTVFGVRVDHYHHKKYLKLNSLDRKMIQVEVVKFFQDIVNKKTEIDKTQTKLTSIHNKNAKRYKQNTK